MNLLLDTHAFLWLMEAPEKLPPKTLKICASPANRLFLSLASVWEMQIKIGLGKLKLKGALSDLVTEQLTSNSVESLPIQLSHLWGLSKLPTLHADPFDRLLVAQAQIEKMVLITADEAIRRYKITVLW